jgi:choice-of-anchor C domain-containing protein
MRGRLFLSAFSAVIIVAAGVLMGFAGPASASSVVITPTSTMAFVHASNDGSASVDVVVCATFDRPVRFIEARVVIGQGLGVAIHGPVGGGAVTNWCGSATDLFAGIPGLHIIDVLWSAHTGNGLSEGHAHSSGSYTVPEPPPVPKKTPEQQAQLGHASNAMWIACSVLAISAAVVAVVATGGAAAVAVASLGIGSGIYGVLASKFSDLAIDPPDPDYTATVVPHNIPLPAYVAGSGISPAAADALNALRLVQEDESGLADAMVAALFKAEGAAAAHDATWERTQTLAAADFAHQLATDLNSEPPLRSAARGALEAGGFPVFTVSEAQAAAAQAAWDSPGLTPALKDAVTLGGARPDMGDRLHARANSLSPTSFVQQNILDLLAPPAGGPALNTIEQATAEAAAALLGWSDALRLNPVGPFPPSPAIVTGVQPSLGPAAGGTTVTVTGSNLLEADQINFGTKPALSGSCTDFQCTVVSPPGTGTVDVTAVGPGGTSAITPADRFTYVTATTGPAQLPLGTLVANGGFDPPGSEIVQSFDTLSGTTGSVKLGAGWTITAGSVDLVGPSSGQAAEGVQFVDLNGNNTSGVGAISQAVPTLSGHMYRLSFRLAGNPNGPPAVKSLTASFGATTRDFTFDTTGHSNTNLGWVEKTVDALSCDQTLPLTLQTTTEGIRGPNVDAVSVVDLGLAPAGSCLAPVNHPPLAEDQTVTTDQDMPTPITLHATDEDSDPLTYATVNGPAHGTLSGTAPALTYTPVLGYFGPDSFTFKANDGTADSNTATVSITVKATDRKPPTTTLALNPANPNGENGWYVTNVHATVSASDETGGSGVAETRCVLDPASPPLTFDEMPVGCAYTAAGADITTDGIHTFYAASKDKAANKETPISLTLKIDATPPTCTATANPNTLWPPNNKLIPITVAVTVTDTGSGPNGFRLLSVTSSEPVDSIDNTQGWTIGTPDTTGLLRARRAGNGPGRTYTLTYTATDNAGNTTTTCQALVTVPHDQRK